MHQRGDAARRIVDEPILHLRHHIAHLVGRELGVEHKLGAMTNAIGDFFGAFFGHQLIVLVKKLRHINATQLRHALLLGHFGVQRIDLGVDVCALLRHLRVATRNRSCKCHNCCVFCDGFHKCFNVFWS